MQHAHLLSILWLWVGQKSRHSPTNNRFFTKCIASGNSRTGLKSLIVIFNSFLRSRRINLFNVDISKMSWFIFTILHGGFLIFLSTLYNLLVCPYDSLGYDFSLHWQNILICKSHQSIALDQTMSELNLDKKHAPHASKHYYFLYEHSSSHERTYYLC